MEKINEISYCIGRRADYQGPRLPVMDQAGDDKCTSGTYALSEHYLSRSPKGRRKRAETLGLSRNTGDWNEEVIMQEYEGTSFSTNWRNIEENIPREPEHHTRKNNTNQNRSDQKRKTRPKNKTLLIENMNEFKSYDSIEDIVCKHGKADRIKQLMQESDKVKCYIIYETYQDALKTIKQEGDIKEELGNQISIRMVDEVEQNRAFIGKEPYIINKQQKERERIKNKRAKLIKETIPKFFWAKFKPNTRKRFFEANKWLYKKIGHSNWKKHNGGILIEAEIDQANILKQLKQEIIETSPFAEITPHNKFNTTWGEIFSWELEDHLEQDLLDVCPEEVINVIRPWKDKPLFFLEFNKPDLTYISDIKIENLNIPLKLKKPQPMICKKCLNYGHTEKWCKTSHRRCRNCAKPDHAEDDTECEETKCYHCEGNHTAISKNCPKYKEEQTILEKMHLLKIDRREARKMIREKTYASATINSTIKNDNRNENGKTSSQRYSDTQNLSKQTSKENIKAGVEGYQMHKPSPTTINPKQQDGNLPRENNEETPLWGTLPARAANNMTDGHVQKGRLRTSTTVAEVHSITTKSLQTETDKPITRRKDENIPVTTSNQYTILSEPSVTSEDELEEEETKEQVKIRTGSEAQKTRTKRRNQKAKPKSKTEIKCLQCRTEYQSEQCKITHEQYAHNNQNLWQSSSQYKCEYREREHRCPKEGNKSACITLYQYKTKNGTSLYIDSREVKYNDIKSFRLGITSQRNQMTEDDIINLGGRRTFCPNCRSCEFSSEKCLQIHKEFFHNQLKYENGARPFDHRCYLAENRCVDIMELINDKGIKTYMDENKTLYNSIEEYRTQPLKTQREQRRNKRQLDTTTPPPPDNNIKKNKQDDDHDSTFSEGLETQSVSELRDYFENQSEDPISINIDHNLNDTEKNNLRGKTDENIEEMESKVRPRDDIYFSQTPENISYITEDEDFNIRTQNMIISEEYKTPELENQHTRETINTLSEETQK